MTAPTHGTWSRYRAGCRCEPCRAAKASAQKAYRDRVKARTEHGTAATYKGGCRCEDCRAYNRESVRAWKLRTGYRGMTAPVPDDGIIDEVVIERLRSDPSSWRAISATRGERIEAARILGAASWAALGLSGREFRDVAS